MMCRGAAGMAMLAALVASGCRTAAPADLVGTAASQSSQPTQPMLGVGAVGDDPAITTLPPCQIAAEVVVARATQTLAEAMLERDLSQQVVGMLRRVVRSRCEHDDWSEPTLTCYRDATVDTDPMVVCADTMSADQLQRLTIDIGAEMDQLRADMH